MNTNLFINAYIGNNVDKIKETKFSFYALLFGGLYLLYRKLWILGIIWFAISLCCFFNLYLLILLLVINVILAIFFKKIYLWNVERTVINVIKNNPNASNQDLMLICKKRGGINKWLVVSCGVIYVVLILIMLLFNNSEKSKKEEDTNIIGYLDMEVSDEFEASEFNSNVYKHYMLNNDTDFCTINLNVVRTEHYESAKAFLEGNISIYEDSDDDGVEEEKEVGLFEKKEINGVLWDFVSLKSSRAVEYHFATISKDRVYNFDFRIYQDGTGTCSSSYNKVLETLKFVK